MLELQKQLVVAVRIDDKKYLRRDYKERWEEGEQRKRQREEER